MTVRSFHGRYSKRYIRIDGASFYPEGEKVRTKGSFKGISVPLSPDDIRRIAKKYAAANKLTPGIYDISWKDNNWVVEKVTK